MAIPTLAMIPSGYKAGKLYSVLPSDGTGDFTVARNSVATRVNQSGLIEEVGVNVPRLDYSAGGCPVLLTEIQSQNLVTYSEDFENYFTMSEVTLNSNYAISPDGTLNANKVTFPSASKSMYKSGLSLSGTHTASFWYKGDGSNIGKTFNVRLALGASVQNFNVTLESGWKRFEAQNNGLQVIEITNRNNTTIGTGSLLLYGFQVEAQPAATSYIKTTGTAQTREADLVNGAGSAATFNSLEHTFFVDINSYFKGGVGSAISIVGSIGTVTDNRFRIQKQANHTQVQLQIRSDGSTVATETLSNIDFSVRQKLAITVKLNEVKYYLNGFLVATDTGTIPLPVSLGEITLTSGTTGFPFYASTKDIRYYNQVLTAAETLELMSYDSFNEMASALQYTIK